MSESRPIHFQTDEEVQAEWDAFRAYVQAGNHVPLLREDGVTLLEVEALPDGSFEVRSAKN